MSFLSDLKDLITGNATVKHTDFNGASLSSAGGETTSGKSVYVEQIRQQTIISMGNEAVIVNANQHGAVAYRYQKSQEGEQRLDNNGAALLGQVVSQAMADGEITPKEFDRISQTADNIANHIPPSGGGRGHGR